MGSNIIIKYSLGFIILVLIQALIFKPMTLGWENFNYISVIIYPMFIMLLPIKTPHPLIILIGFTLGLAVDMFYNSPGVHASASVFSAFIRPFILSALEPRGGYNVNHSPTKSNFGFSWFATYACIMLLAHLFFYFSMEAFTFVYIGQIIMRTVFSFFASIIFVLLFQFLLDSK